MAHPDGMPVIVTAVVAAPWGPIRVAASELGLVAVDQLVTEEAFLERLERRFGVRPQPFDPATSRAAAAVRMREALEALAAYLAGDAAALLQLPVDLGDRPAWDQLVLGAVRGIVAGTTASYGEIARRIGRAGAARAVGGAVGRNPVGLVIPCHRVIAGDGSLGGYGGGWWGGRQAGIELKRELLAREGVHIPTSAGTA
jgi:methylated-DNA-[protein]-cysteine S-methyltransferase